ncbi:MAG: 1-(5-phosphoribosyl)-5-[(5-phosphoribosylamino)methylideneamino]imidazole-4-carboxamide isomerase [Euryarchaeota archaeon]|nr:1-(5-phosphoribosyl)-5-[(5-phosphoribosylamino)methylideneamino]imidazole-4-carboxamide isomerase [Euryarchaeota archaeon]
MSFLVIPALDLSRGKCVQLVGGRLEQKLVELAEPLSVALHWQEQGAERLHLIDLDAAIHGSTENRALVLEIVRELEIPVQVGGGIRSREVAEEVLGAGAAKVIVGTAVVKNRGLLEELSEEYGSDRVIAAVDARGSRVVVRGWQESTALEAQQLAKEVAEYVDEVLFTCVHVEGRMQGVDARAVERVVRATSAGVLVAGGIASASDLRLLKRLGAAGAVLGSALYTGRLSLREAMRAVQD